MSDRFATTDLRAGLGRAASDSPATATAEVEALRKGKPAGLHLWQGVKGGTARLSLRTNLAELRALATDLDALERKLNAAGNGKAKGDEDDSDDDDEDEAKEQGAAKGKTKARRKPADDDT